MATNKTPRSILNYPVGSERLVFFASQSDPFLEIRLHDVIRVAQGHDAKCLLHEPREFIDLSYEETLRKIQVDVNTWSCYILIEFEVAHGTLAQVIIRIKTCKTYLRLCDLFQRLNASLRIERIVPIVVVDASVEHVPFHLNEPFPPQGLTYILHRVDGVVPKLPTSEINL